MDYLYFTLANTFYNQQLLKNVHYKVIRGTELRGIDRLLEYIYSYKESSKEANRCFPNWEQFNRISLRITEILEYWNIIQS